MIRVAVRQHRLQLGVTLAVFVILALILAWTQHEMTSFLRTSGLSACVARNGGGCDGISRLFEDRYGSWLSDSAYLNLLPMLVGVFWGAPLIAREFEQGTHRLAWTQSVSRRRWLLTKLALLLGASIVFATLFSVLLAWWFHPFARLNIAGGFSRMDLNVFDFQGTVPVAYTLYAFALGTTAGVMLHRTVPAMAVTLAAFLPVRLLLQSMRAHYISPLHITYQASSQSPRAGHGDWILSSQLVDRSGHRVPDQQMLSACPPALNISKLGIHDCLSTHGFRTLDIYQPASRFWTLQGIETAILLVIAFILLSIAVWRTLGGPWSPRNRTRIGSPPEPAALRIA